MNKKARNYSVEIGYRTDGGMVSAVSTHLATIEVMALDQVGAGLAAISKAYDDGMANSHVFVRRVSDAKP